MHRRRDEGLTDHMHAYETSPQQRAIWQHADRTGGPLFAQAAVATPADVTAEQIGAALRQVVAAHEILRTTLHLVSGVVVPVQRVTDDPVVTVGEHRLDAQGARQLAARRAADVPVTGDVALVADLVRDGGEQHLLLTAPPTVADGATLSLLVGAVAAGCTTGAVTAVDPDALQYVDAADWQHELLTAEAGAPGRAFWDAAVRTMTAGITAGTVHAAAPFVTTAAEPGSSASTTVPLDDHCATGLRRLAHELDVPVGDLVLTAWRVLLTRLLDGPVPCAVVDANRRFDELRPVAGPLALALPTTLAVVDGLDVASAVRATSAELRDRRDRAEFCDPAAGADLTFAFAWDRSEPLPAGWSWRALQVRATPAALTLAGLDRGDGLMLTLRHHTGRTTGPDADRLAGMLASLLAGFVADRSARCAELPLDPAPTVVVATEPVDDAASLPELVAARSAATPDAIAVSSGTTLLTYRQLHTRAGQLADRLRAVGVRAETVVAVELPRGTELVAALLGVLYAGGACLPLEPGLPPVRRARLLAAAAPVCLVSDSPPSGPDDPPHVHPADIGPTAEWCPPLPVAGEQLAYVLFTSGSSGEPKGVCVPHRAIAAYVTSLQQRVEAWGVHGPSSWAVVSSFAADLGLTAVWGALGSGGTLHVVDQDAATDPARLRAVLAGGRAGRVDCLKIVPSHLRALLSSPHPAELLPARLLVLGGEAADWDLVDRVRTLAPEVRVVNHYGPTETAVGVLTHELWPAAGSGPRRAAPALGAALPHARVAVVDRSHRPTATWQPGEIMIGGSSLARGYLGRPGVTAERFLPDPDGAVPGARRYRTGDAAGRDSEGTVTFLGRLDDQLNLHGHRIEPREIIATLRECPQVADAAVLVVDGNLTAYVAPAIDHDGPAALAAARDQAVTRLPEALRPTRWATVGELPRTTNGKLDRGALATVAATADPGAGSLPTVAAEAPRPGVETTLAAIWTEVLNLRGRTLSRHDNFFAVGGDSILSIQVIGRAEHAGIALSPALMFRFQTIAELAAAERPDAPVPAEQGPVRGSFAPTPVQQWFLDQALPTPGHYNQALLMRAPTPLRPAALRRALGAVITHHDGLRLRMTAADAPDFDHAEPGADPVPLTVVDLGGVDDPTSRRRLTEQLADAVQRAGDLHRGPVLRALYLQLPDGDASEPGDRLLLVAHHVGMDGVSWRIVLDDLATAYRSTAALPRKTTSYLAYARRLADLAASVDEPGTELAHWLAVPEPAPAPVEPGTVGDARRHEVVLDEVTTQRLLDLEGRSGTSTLDALLAALAHALVGTPWASGSTVVVDLEHHGRDHGWTDIDLTRTVGWFTTIHPLAVHAGPDPVATCAQARRSRLAIPDHGRNWMLWRHHRATPGHVRSQLAGRPRPAIRVNYLGRFRSGAGDQELLAPVPGTVGATQPASAARPYALDVTAICTHDRMTITWTHPAGLDVSVLAADHLAHLDAITSADDELDHADWAAQADLDDDELAGLLDQLDGITVAEERS